ncbi:MAG: hypothetical protein HUU35_01480, partial [Armatimonadetes bacterium]|nr:hypothetical protein [Armatimonadota bacterium]
DLVPGSAVAASLTTGDIVLTALGTVSWRGDDRLLAFGHPFLQRGATSIFLHPAYIYGVVPSVELPFKVGAPAGPPVGAFVEDRAAGLGGVLGRVARSVTLSIDAGDGGLGRRRTLNVQAVLDDELAPTLLAVTIMQAMAEVMDRAGGGTARMEWSIEGEGLAQPLRRDDLIYSANDIIGEAMPGPLFTLDALLRNDFSLVVPKRVEVKVDVLQERRTARLIEVTCEPKTAKAGDEVTVRARLQPYRGQPLERNLTFRIPADTAPGSLVVEVHGRPAAADGPLSQAVLMARGLAPPASLDELVRVLSSAQRGNSLSAELLTPEAANSRQQVFERLDAMPSLDLFSEEPQALPTLGGALEVGVARPLAQAEVTLDHVVQGRLRTNLAVLAP